MKIKHISCTQFAGIRDRSISFTDGINVVYGKNESGKSTFVNMISRTLFQSAKLHRKYDKDFLDLYFPSINRGSGIAGDSADGTISFETEKGDYTLSKEWGTDSRCILFAPDGVIRDQSKIEEVLKDTLLYGEGVYSDMLFSSQRNTKDSLQAILDDSQKTDAKQEIADRVSQAFAESGGISVDAMEQAIAAKVDEIAGKHWECDREMPARPARGTGRWSNGLGEILKAYYALEDAKAVLEEISRLESGADHAAMDYMDKDAAARAAEEAYNRFHSFASRLAVQGERKKAVDRIERERRKIEEGLSGWPKLSESLGKAKRLQTEKKGREILDKYEAAKEIVDELNAMNTNAAGLACPTDQEMMQVKTAQRDVASLENKLCGMNLNAVIHMLGDNRVEITSLRTGEMMDAAGGIASITEAVRITVPGIMELQLSPADVDVASVESQIAGQKKVIGDIFAKYNVGSLDMLEALAKTIADTKAKVEAANNRLSVLLGSTAFEKMEETAMAIAASIRTKEEIDHEILAVCGSDDITRFITQKETLINSYLSEYGSIDDLKAKAADLEAELKMARESVSDAADIPPEYLEISDIDAHQESLQKDFKEKQRLREDALTAKTAAVSRLESYRENISDDPAAEKEKAERDFQEQKSLLAHWMHIQEVFEAQKEKLHNNPMQDIADAFTRYLGIISGGRVSSEFPEADKLNMNIYSDNKMLNYGKLSEGTKETVSLAFRLAVLDHLFPEGGGVIVLDDPFTDMDADRAAQSCELIKECANRHQVIFLTCREEYCDRLKGNRIDF